MRRRCHARRHRFDSIVDRRETTAATAVMLLMMLWRWMSIRMMVKMMRRMHGSFYTMCLLWWCFLMAPCFVSEHEKREESFDKILRSDNNDDSRA